MRFMEVHYFELCTLLNADKNSVNIVFNKSFFLVNDRLHHSRFPRRRDSRGRRRDADDTTTRYL